MAAWSHRTKACFSPKYIITRQTLPNPSLPRVRPMQLVDTHCHIHEPDYPLAIKEVEAEAKAAGVQRYICVGTDASTSAQAVEFVQNRPYAWATVGLHPHDAKRGIKELQKLTPLAADKKVVAVGECGLDYFYGHSTKKEQEKALRFQIEFALSQKLPLSFHVRDAFDDFWPIFDNYQGLRGVLHSFTDSQAHLEKAVSRGLYIGVNGIATFTKVTAQQTMFKAIPAQKMVLETDAPFLTPAPYRGKVNMPAQVSVIVVFLAQLRGEDPATLAAITTQNAQTLFEI